LNKAARGGRWLASLFGFTQQSVRPKEHRMWQDYVGLFPVAIAAANGFIALLVGQFLKDRPRAKVLLVVSAGILTLCAVGATFYGQSRVIADRAAAEQNRKNIREQLGVYIAVGNTIMGKTEIVSQPAPTDEADKWAADVERFLLTRLDQSYVIRFRILWACNH
jgi:hypothetical protein